ncbi:MAG: bacterial Ig-like domain-containing protein [Clostridiales Family XIII bacterium]|jgi:hypothetical protein|nr:bacterial Ig-like domain-containing protein [Clostridiales Family XIII bacterium]
MLKTHTSAKHKILSILLALLIVVSFMPQVPQVYADDIVGGNEAPIVSTWDGQSYDISWYNTEDTEFTLNSAAQFAGFAAIVNGETQIWDDDTNQPTPWYNGGTAIPGEPLKIGEQTIAADDFTDKIVNLNADVDLGGIYDAEEGTWGGAVWPVIGHYTSSSAAGSNDGLKGIPFKGTFNGNFHSISNMYVRGDYSAADDVASCNSKGLFGDLGHVALVKNVILTSGYVTVARFGGGIVGRNWGNVENCANGATVVGRGRGGAGGIVGANYYNNLPLPEITNSYNFGTVKNLGGSKYYHAGGIASLNEGVITNCYNVGTIISRDQAGGMAAESKTLMNSFTLAGTNVKATANGEEVSRTDALVGKNNGTIDATSAILTSDDMTDPAFVTLLNGEDNAFVPDLSGINQGYPILSGYALLAVSKELYSIEVKTQPNQRAYTSGDSFNKDGLEIEATYLNGEKSILADEDYSVTPEVLSSADTSVTVSYTDGDITKNVTIDGITVEKRTISAITEPAITGDATVNNTLSVSTGEWSETPDAVTYQWYADAAPITGATDSTYKLTVADHSKAITAQVTASKEECHDASIVSSPTAKVGACTIEVQSPSITGTAKVGQTLKVDAGVWNPEAEILGYQWLVNGTEIANATGTSYQIKSGDLGKAISVKVTAKILDYYTVVHTSTKTAKVTADFVKGDVKITGTVKVGKQLKAVPDSKWSPKPTYTYQWYANGQAIKNATKVNYTIASGDFGKQITVKVTAKKANYVTATKTSAKTAKVKAGDFTKGSITISGKAKVGQKLTAKTAKWSPTPTFTYQWYANGKAIKNATKSTYTLKAAEKGKKITVKVTAKKTNYVTVSKTSAKTTNVVK